MLVSKCSRNHFIFEKYKYPQSFKLNLLHSSPLIRQYTSVRDCKRVGNILEAILWKPFQLFRRILNDVSSITEAPFLQCWFQSREQVKTSWSQVRRVWRMLQCCHIVLCYELLNQNRPVCWSIAVKEKPTVDSPFSGAFPSDRIPKATKDVCVQERNLSHAAVPVRFTSEFL